MDNEVSKLTTSLIQKIKEDNVVITPANILDIILIVIQEVETYAKENGGVSGATKKMMSMETLGELVNSPDLINNILDLGFVKNILGTVGSSYIENIILVSKKLTNINRGIKKIEKIFGCFTS